MQLSRTLASILSSSPSPSSSSHAAKWHLLRIAAAFSTVKRPPSARTARQQRIGPEASAEPSPRADEGGQAPVRPEEEAPRLPKPSEIPWQARVANCVHLIGRLGGPVHLGTAPGGVYTAASVLVHKKTHDLPQFWIPIVFQGDLAQIAACNLREKDHVYVTGQLTGESQLIGNNAETKTLVMVQSISYVLELHSEKKHDRNSEGSNSSSAEVKEASLVMQLWKDVFSNPHKWWDNRPKDNKRSGAFKHKDTGQLLEINESTPEWVLSSLDTFVLSSKAPGKSPQHANAKKPEDSVVNHWNDLLENPHQWWDNRVDKQNGKVKPKYPDFSHKITKQGLWLDSAPDSVLPKLESVVVGAKACWKSVATRTSKVLGRKEESWKDLVKNPDKWWDKRSNKSKPNAPDFKHKETGEALWLSSSTPKWVMDKFSPNAEKR